MKPEPSELSCAAACRLRARRLGPPPPRRFLKKSSKNSSNGEPGAKIAAPRRGRRPPCWRRRSASRILTTASITFSRCRRCRQATGEKPAPPPACGGTKRDRGSHQAQATAQSGLAPVMSACLQEVDLRPQCARTGLRRKHLSRTFRRKTGIKPHDPLIRRQSFRDAGRVRKNRFSTTSQTESNPRRRADAHRAQNMVGRRLRALHGAPHPGRACRNIRPSSTNKDSHTDEESRTLGTSSDGTSRYRAFAFNAASGFRFA